jgi:hypothetical protein
MKFEQDAMPRRGYSVYTFSNCRQDRSISGVISKKDHAKGFSVNIRVTDLDLDEVKAVFRALGVKLPQL